MTPGENGPSMTSSPFRALSAAGIIGRSLRLYQANIALLVIVAALPHAVLLLLEYLLRRVVDEPTQILPLALLATVVLNAVALAAITAVVAGAVLGYPPKVGQAYAITFGKSLIWVVLAYVATAVVVSMGFMFFILPGLILGGFLAPVIPIVVIESRTPFAAIGRAFALMKTELPKGMAVFVFAILVSGVIPLLVQIALGPGPLSPLLGAAAGAITLPLGFTPNVVLYLSVRSREGYTPEQLAADIRNRVAGSAPS